MHEIRFSKPSILASLPLAIFLIATASLAAAPLAAAEIEVVTTLSAYAVLAEEVGGERVNVRSISRGDEDSHFVKPKPSFALMLRDADVFVTTGLDLELWAPVLLDKSGNREIREGSAGYVNASEGVPLLDVPASADRSGGDVHAFGNPHVFTSPLNAKIIAANIAAGFERVDPEGADFYGKRLVGFQSRIDEALYGKELLEVLPASTLEPLARQGRLIPFLEGQMLGEAPLVDRLGGWLGRARPFHDAKIVAYHKNWIYLTELLAFEVVDYVEPKPGIPPSARHVHGLIERIQASDIQVILAASYFEIGKVNAIAKRTGCAVARVPLGPVDGKPATYFGLFELWLSDLEAAFAAGGR